jgi:RNA polymerase sigma-70 factor (ECF subfamily)
MQAMAGMMRLDPIAGGGAPGSGSADPARSAKPAAVAESANPAAPGNPALAVEPADPADPARPALPADTAEAQLVRASLAGDEQAFAVLVRRYQARVFRLAGRFFRQPQDVEEVAQETFLRAWMKLGTYGARAPFEHWLTRLCLRCAFDRLRRPGDGRLRQAPSAAAPGRVAAPLPGTAADATGTTGRARVRRLGLAAAAEPGRGLSLEEVVEAPAVDPTARLEVERLLARLQPADRFLLVLLEAEGWSVAEIAERLGWSRVNVKVRAHRARQRLRRVLEEG